MFRVVLGASMLLAGTPTQMYANTSSETLRNRCQVESSQDFPYDGHRIRFDGLEHQGKVLYCVVIDGADHEYRIEWPAVRISGVSTLHGIQYSYFWSPDPRQDIETEARIGHNRTSFNVWVSLGGRSETAVGDAWGMNWSVHSVFYGSLPLDAFGEDISPATITVEASASEDGTCTLSAVDAFADDRPKTIDLRLPASVLELAIEADIHNELALTGESHQIIYRFTGGELAPALVSLPITDEAGFVLGSIPAVICMTR